MAGRVYDYGRLRGTATRLVRRFGRSAELRRGGASYPTYVTFTDFKDRDVDGTRIKRSDFIGLISPGDVGVAPTGGDKLYWDGAERAVVDVSVTKPGPVEVLYQLQLRGRPR